MNWNTFLFIGLFAVLLSCNKDDNGDDDQQDTSTNFVVYKDGQAQSARNSINVFTINELEEENFREAQLLIGARVGDWNIQLTVVDYSYYSDPINPEFLRTFLVNADYENEAVDCVNFGPDQDYCEDILLAYFPSNPEDVDMSYTSSGIRDAGIVEITSFDADAKKVSGTFDIMVSDIQSTETDTIHFTGSFTDLSFIRQSI